MIDVFLSYSKADQSRVAAVADALAAAGYAVWWDTDLPPHRAYREVIEERITEAKAVIVIWSESAAASEWVNAEADLARGQRKLIQASLDGRMPPMPFNQIQVAPIGDWKGQDDHPGWRKILAAVVELCGRDALPAPRTAAARGSIGRYAVPAALGIALLAGLAAIPWLRGDDPDADTSDRLANAQVPAIPMPSTSPYSIVGQWRDDDGYSYAFAQDGASYRYDQRKDGAAVGSGTGTIDGRLLRHSFSDGAYATGSCTGEVSIDARVIAGRCTDADGASWPFRITR